MENSEAKLSSCSQPWGQTQLIEQRWWGNCVNTHEEEIKQQVYAEKMGLERFACYGRFQFPMDGKSIVDIGGGPVSLLLKCTNVRGTVVDPFRYPAWVASRYLTAGIRVITAKAEDFDETGWDEAWMYNVLQHVDDPGKVVAGARRASRVLRVFDWIDIPQQGPHRHVLTKEMLDDLYKGSGTVEPMSADGCYGSAYYGVFTGECQE